MNAQSLVTTLASANASVRQSMRGRRLVGAIAGLAAGMTPVLAACTTSTPTLANVTAAEAATIDQACEQTLGARRGDGYFEACRSSLADTVQRQDAGRRIAQTQAGCAQAGLQEGSSEFGLCVLGVRPSPAPRKSLAAARDEVHQRAELSCAKLGLSPAAFGFAGCVTDLETSISQVDSPSS